MQINIPIKYSHPSLSPQTAWARLLFIKRQCMPKLQTRMWESACGIHPAATLLDSVQQIQTVICLLNRWLFWLQVKSHEHQSHVTTSLQRCWPRKSFWELSTSVELNLNSVVSLPLRAEPCKPGEEMKRKRGEEGASHCYDGWTSSATASLPQTNPQSLKQRREQVTVCAI